MSTHGTTTKSTSPSRGSFFVLWAARILLALVGLVTSIGAVYFSFFASAEQGGVSRPVDWVFGAVALIMAGGYLLAAVRLGRSPSDRALRLTAALVVGHVLYSIVKIIGYSEAEAVTFLIADLVILGLLAISRRSRQADQTVAKTTRTDQGSRKT